MGSGASSKSGSSAFIDDDDNVVYHGNTINDGDVDDDDDNIVYHGTSKNCAEKIMRNGFKPSEDGLLGPGTYVTPDISKAAAFASKFGHMGRIVKAQANFGNTSTVDASDAREGGYSETSWQMSHDTAYTPSGEGVARPEYCVKDASRVTPIDSMDIPRWLQSLVAHRDEENEDSGRGCGRGHRDEEDEDEGDETQESDMDD